MKGSPAKMGTIQGTSGHASALKKKEDDIHKLVEKRRKLKEKKDKLDNRKEEGKKTLLGDYRRKRKEKQLEKVQEKINKNPKAQEWKKKGDAKEEIDGGKKEEIDGGKGGKKPVPSIDIPEKVEIPEDNTRVVKEPVIENVPEKKKKTVRERVEDIFLPKLPGMPMKGSPATKKDNIEKLLKKRKKLKERKEKREEKGKKTKRIDRRIDRNQQKINENPTARKWKKDSEEKSIAVDSKIRDGVKIKDRIGIIRKKTKK